MQETFAENGFDSLVLKPVTIDKLLPPFASLVYRTGGVF